MRFSVFRIALGLFLLSSLFIVWPWLDLLYSSTGLMPAYLIPTKTFVPRFLLAYDAPWLLRTYALFAMIGSTSILLGYQRKIGALLAFVPFWFFSHRNPFAVTEESAFILWLLLATLLVPEGEPLSLGKKDPNWQEPRSVRIAAWFAIAVGYTYAGLYKLLHAESFWRNGTALYYVLAETNSRRHWYGEAYAFLPMIVYRAATYLLMAVQLLAIPLLATRFTRRLAWTIMVLFHLGALVTMDIEEISLGMLVVHLFVWNPFLKKEKQP